MKPKIIIKPRKLLFNIDRILYMRALILILILVVQIIPFSTSLASEIPANQCKCDFGHYFDGEQCILEEEPLLCTDNYEPVCGCDGVVYSNSCGAQISGVKVFTKGVCGLSSEFSGRWKAKSRDSNDLYKLRLFFRDGILKGTINGKRIVSEKSLVRGINSILVYTNKGKKFELRITGSNQMTILLEDGLEFKARKIN